MLGHEHLLVRLQVMQDRQAAPLGRIRRKIMAEKLCPVAFKSDATLLVEPVLFCGNLVASIRLRGLLTEEL